jgi:hypothetical protein
VDVKKSHVNSSPSLRHQMQQHRDTERDTEDDDLRDECSPPLKGKKKKKEKKTTLCAWHQQSSTNKSRIQIATEAKFAERRILRRAEAARGTAFFWSHYILATTQQQVGPTC